MFMVQSVTHMYNHAKMQKIAVAETVPGVISNTVQCLRVSITPISLRSSRHSTLYTLTGIRINVCISTFIFSSSNPNIAKMISEEMIYPYRGKMKIT